MTVWCAALFLAWGPGDLPTELTYGEPALEDGFFGRLYGGVWGSRRFRFAATEASGNSVFSGREGLESVGFDGGTRFAEHLVLFATVEGDYRSDIRSELAGVSLGYRDSPLSGAPPGVPDEVMIYAGPIGGRFDVTTPGFGKFKDSVGGRLGLDLFWLLGRHGGVSLCAEYRRIAFEYEPSVIQGDSRIGGGTYWLGAKAEIRF
jgi:hypothetical protein